MTGVVMYGFAVMFGDVKCGGPDLAQRDNLGSKVALGRQRHL